MPLQGFCAIAGDARRSRHQPVRVHVRSGSKPQCSCWSRCRSRYCRRNKEAGQFDFIFARKLSGWTAADASNNGPRNSNQDLDRFFCRAIKLRQWANPDACARKDNQHELLTFATGGKLRFARSSGNLWKTAQSIFRKDRTAGSLASCSIGRMGRRRGE